MTLRIAAAGDIHAFEDDRERVIAAFEALSAEGADLLLIAGDLTTHGEPAQAAVVADACRRIDIPVLAVLGNHDCHAGRRDEVVAVLADAGVRVLERDHAVVDVDGVRVGITGCKGFIGGFPGSHLPDFGEPLLRRCYAEMTADVAALDEGLREIVMCPVRVVLLHYAPCSDTLEGEPHGIWTMLGCDRLAEPIRQHEPDLVLHGHAHAGTFESTIGVSPVYNVSVPVIERDFWVFEMR
jgi:Icc-related predicted phosphoesterase